MFDILNSRDYLHKLEAEYADFKAQPDSARHALNCIMTGYHLYEWVWGDWLKSDYQAWKKIGGVRDKDSFKKRLAELWPDFNVAEELTNGTKHFIKDSVKTERAAGFGKGHYGIGPYGQPYLLIDRGSDCVSGLQTAE